MSVVYLTFWMWQVDDNNTALANKRLKNAVNYATHDASLQLKQAELGTGRIVFDIPAAENTFRQTLQDNLVLDNSLNPKPGTLFKQKLTVIFTDFIDDDDGKTYPFFYENDIYGIHHWIYGPSVIFAVEVQRPVVFNVNPVYNLVKWAVFEYPVP